MPKLRAAAFLVLERERFGMRIADMRKNKPALRAGQVAVRVQLTIEDSMFEELIPTVSAEIHPGEVLEPTVEVLPSPTAEEDS